MKRYPLGVIVPEWKHPVPWQPKIAKASDRAGFGVLHGGQLNVYRLGYVVSSPSVVENAWSAVLGKSTVYALGPGARTLAVATGQTIQVSDETKGPLGELSASGTVADLAFSASGKTLWAALDKGGAKPGRLQAWDTATLRPVGDVEVFALQGSVFELVTHPKLERAGVDAAAGQDGSSFTFVDRGEPGLTVLKGSHHGDDGVALGALFDDGALLISREAIVLIDVNTGAVLAGPRRATLGWMREEMIFDYQRGYIDDYCVLSGRFDEREDEEDEEVERAQEDVPQGRLRIYDTQLGEVLEMPSTDDPYETPWAVAGLVWNRVLVCQADALMLYNLQPYLSKAGS